MPNDKQKLASKINWSMARLKAAASAIHDAAFECGISLRAERDACRLIDEMIDECKRYGAIRGLNYHPKALTSRKKER